MASSPLDRHWRPTTMRNITTTQLRISMARSLMGGNVESILLPGPTMLITIHAAPHGTGRLRTKPLTITLRKARQMPHGINTTAESLRTTCWKLPAVPPIYNALALLPTVLRTPRLSEPVVVLLPQVRVVCRPGGRNDTPQKVGPTMWIITPVRPPGWIRGDKQLSALWARTVRAHLYSRKQFRNLVPCRLGGKCDSHRQPVCTLLITIPKRLHGTIHGCRRRSMQM